MGSISDPPEGNADGLLSKGSQLNQWLQEIADASLLAAVVLQGAPQENPWLIVQAGA